MNICTKVTIVIAGFQFPGFPANLVNFNFGRSSLNKDNFSFGAFQTSEPRFTRTSANITPSHAQSDIPTSNPNSPTHITPITIVTRAKVTARRLRESRQTPEQDSDDKGETAVFKTSP